MVQLFGCCGIFEAMESTQSRLVQPSVSVTPTTAASVERRASAPHSACCVIQHVGHKLIKRVYHKTQKLRGTKRRNIDRNDSMEGARPHPKIRKGTPTYEFLTSGECLTFMRMRARNLAKALSGLISDSLLSWNAIRDIQNGREADLLLGVMMVCAGRNRQEITSRLSIAATTLQDSIPRLIPVLKTFFYKALPWAVLPEHRREALSFHGGLAPGLVGFVDGLTWETKATSSDKENRIWYSNLHSMYGYNFLLFCSVSGRVIWIEPMGKGNTVSEIAAARRATERMLRSGAIKQGEYFVGDGVFQGVRPAVRHLPGNKALEKMAARVQSLWVSSPAPGSLHSPRDLARATASALAHKTVQREIFVSGRQVVENCVKEFKTVCGLVRSSSVRPLQAPTKEKEIRDMGYITAGMLAFQQAEGHRVPRSEQWLHIRGSRQPALVLFELFASLAGDCPASNRRDSELDASLPSGIAKRRSVSFLHDVLRLLRGAELGTAGRPSLERSDIEAATQLQQVLAWSEQGNLSPLVSGILCGGLTELGRLKKQRRQVAVSPRSGVASPGGGSSPGIMASPHSPPGYCRPAKTDDDKVRPQEVMDLEKLWGAAADKAALAGKPVVVGKYNHDPELSFPRGIVYALIEPTRDTATFEESEEAYDVWYYDKYGDELLETLPDGQTGGHLLTSLLEAETRDVAKKDYTWLPPEHFKEDFDGSQLVAYMMDCQSYNYGYVNE